MSGGPRKVEKVVSTRPLSQAGAFTVLSRFLKTELEQHDAITIQQSHWEELYRVAESLVVNEHEKSPIREKQHKRLRELRLKMVVSNKSPSSSCAAYGVTYNNTDGTTAWTTPKFRSDEKLIPIDHTSSIRKEGPSVQNNTLLESSHSKKKRKIASSDV